MREVADAQRMAHLHPRLVNLNRLAEKTGGHLGDTRAEQDTTQSLPRRQPGLRAFSVGTQNDQNRRVVGKLRFFVSLHFSSIEYSKCKWCDIRDQIIDAQSTRWNAIAPAAVRWRNPIGLISSHCGVMILNKSAEPDEFDNFIALGLTLHEIEMGLFLCRFLLQYLH